MKAVRTFLTVLCLSASIAVWPVSTEAEPLPVEVSFPRLWDLVQKHAPSEQAGELELKAFQAEQERAIRQGYPRLFLDARAFSTNDSALSFISLLNQREIQSSDFSPDFLNYPGHQFFQKATLGLDWPFYDGGAKRSRIDSQAKEVLAKTFEKKNSRLQLYQETASLFGSAMIFEKQSDSLGKLSETVNRNLERYRIGVKSNPLGYSGLLGLKTLKNRINEALLENDVHRASAKSALEEKAMELPRSWSPRTTPGDGESIADFVRMFLPSSPDNAKARRSAQSEKLQAEAEAAEKRILGEKAARLPRAGLFSEASLANGNRDLASSYVLGLYLRWDIFSMEPYKKAERAELNSLAMKARAEDFRLKEKIDTENAKRSSEALEKRIALATESSRLLEEQTITSQKLFSTGAINMLQFLEVLNQNLEITLNLNDAEIAYLNENLIRIKGTDFEIPIASAGGQSDQ